MANVDVNINDVDYKYNLEFILDENDKPIEVSLRFIKENGEAEHWDSIEYLENVYHTCDCSINKSGCNPFKLLIHEAIEDGWYKDMDKILDMFNRAIKLGLWTN